MKRKRSRKEVDDKQVEDKEEMQEKKGVQRGGE